MNKVILIGRLTADPELRKTASDVSVANYTLAVKRAYSKGGEAQTDFIDCVTWRGGADFAGKYLKKGMQIAIVGKIETRNWEDKNGNKRRSWTLYPEKIRYLDKRREEPEQPAFEEVEEEDDEPKRPRTFEDLFSTKE